MTSTLKSTQTSDKQLKISYVLGKDVCKKLASFLITIDICSFIVSVFVRERTLKPKVHSSRKVFDVTRIIQGFTSICWNIVFSWW